MKIIEDIVCICCENTFRITFDDSDVTDKLAFCTFCGEDLSEEDEDEDYIEEDNDKDE